MKPACAPSASPPRHGAETLQRLVDSGRLDTDNGDGLPLAEGGTRPAQVGWRVDARGLQRPLLAARPVAELIVPVQPPWYVDLTEGEAGPLEVAGNPAVVTRLFSLPPLSAKEAAVVAQTLAELAPDLPKPAEDAAVDLRMVDVSLQPILRVEHHRDARQPYLARLWQQPRRRLLRRRPTGFPLRGRRRPP